MKAACYCATRNLYYALRAPINSLLANSDVERVFLLIEDDALPYPLPSCVTCVNVSGQRFFDPSGPNYNNGWTWMSLMRTALHRVFPDLDQILSLDVDTIVVQDISNLWDVSLDGYWLAAVPEPKRSLESMYINAGVMLLNLQQLREDGKGDELIETMNRKPYDYCDQDCISEICRGGILEIPSAYNVNAFTGPTAVQAIVHYAAIPWWQTEKLVELWRDRPWVR